MARLRGMSTSHPCRRRAAAAAATPGSSARQSSESVSAPLNQPSRGPRLAARTRREALSALRHRAIPLHIRRQRSSHQRRERRPRGSRARASSQPQGRQGGARRAPPAYPGAGIVCVCVCGARVRVCVFGCATHAHDGDVVGEQLQRDHGEDGGHALRHLGEGPWQREGGTERGVDQCMCA